MIGLDKQIIKVMLESFDFRASLLLSIILKNNLRR